MIAKSRHVVLGSFLVERSVAVPDLSVYTWLLALFESVRLVGRVAFAHQQALHLVHVTSLGRLAQAVGAVEAHPSLEVRCL